MKKRIKIILLTITLVWIYSFSIAQKSTEIYIPVGKSPGISGKYSTIGRVEAINLTDSTITIAIAGELGSHTIKCAKDTKIWVDKSSIKQFNKDANLIDIKIGSIIEIKYKGNKSDALVEWIKIQIE